MPANPVADYIRKEINDIKEKNGLKAYVDARQQVFSFAEKLVESGTIAPFDWKTITMDQAKSVFDAIKAVFEGDAA